MAGIIPERFVRSRQPAPQSPGRAAAFKAGQPACGIDLESDGTQLTRGPHGGGMVALASARDDNLLLPGLAQDNTSRHGKAMD